MPIRQDSAWGQFWFDLREQHGVSGGAIFTPLCSDYIRHSYVAPNGAPFCNMLAPYSSLWVLHTRKGAVYRPVGGDTMCEMLIDGLLKFDAASLRMKANVLAVAVEGLTHKMESMGL